MSIISFKEELIAFIDSSIFFNSFANFIAISFPYLVQFLEPTIAMPGFVNKSILPIQFNCFGAFFILFNISGYFSSSIKIFIFSPPYVF